MEDHIPERPDRSLLLVGQTSKLYSTFNSHMVLSCSIYILDYCQDMTRCVGQWQRPETTITLVTMVTI